MTKTHLLVLAVALGAAAAGAAEPDPFSYDRTADLKVVEAGVEHRGEVSVRDVSFASPGLDKPVKAYVVVPPGAGPFRGVLWAHWLGESASDRTQYLPEAVALASQGVASVLVNAMWSEPRWYGTRDIEHDRDRSIAQVVAFRRALDLLETVPGVDRSRIGFVGHDYGGMHGMLMAAADGRPRTYVFIACAPSLNDWAFFGRQPASKAAYLRQNADMDLTDALRRTKNASTLFQFGARDMYVSGADTLMLMGAAQGRKERRVYEADHSMEAPEAARDREAWLAKELAATP